MDGSRNSVYLKSSSSRIYCTKIFSLVELRYPCSFSSTSAGNKAASGEHEEQVLESLASLTNSKRVLASLLPEVWQRAEALLAKGHQERCSIYLSTVEKVMLNDFLRRLISSFKGGRWGGHNLHDTFTL